MFQSPLKTVSEKIKPVQSKSTVASLKFERSSDFKKFIDFIKKETQEIENLKLPKKDDIKPKSKLPNALGILGLAGFAALAALFGGDKKDKKGEKPFVSFAGGAKFALKSKSLITSSPKKRFKTSFTKRTPETLKLRKKFNKIVNTVKLNAKDEKGKPIRMSLKKFLKAQKKDIKRLLKERRDMFKVRDKLDMEGVKFTDPAYLSQLVKIEELERTIRDELTIRKIFGKEIPLSKTTVTALRDLIKESKIAGELGDSARETIAGYNEIDPEFETKILSKVKKLDPLLFDVKTGDTAISKILGKFGPKAKLFGEGVETKMFKVRDSLDDFFTGIGKSTKTLRGRISKFGKSFMKSKTPTLGLRSVLGTGSKAFKFLTSSRVSFAATFLSLFYDSYDAIVNQDDPFTGYYNVFVRYHNKIVKDPTKLRLIKGKVSNRIGLSQEKMDKINLERDRYNQDILRRRNAAKNNNEISSVPQNSSGIVPIAQKKQSAPFEITLSPTINSTKFINEKLYKQ